MIDLRDPPAEDDDEADTGSWPDEPDTGEPVGDGGFQRVKGGK